MKRKGYRLFSQILAIVLIALFLVPMPAQAISLKKHEIWFDRVVNARDMGGYRTKNGHHVKKGLLLRSGELSYASAADRKKLRKKYHLGTVIDFRYRTDYTYCPDKRISGVKYRSIPAKYSSSSGKSTPRNRYRRMKSKGNHSFRMAAYRSAGRAGSSYTYSLVMSSYSQKAYRKYFRYLLKNKREKAVLLHCIHGKDRTGVAAFMTLVALGVDEKTAYKEYALTNSFLKKHAPKTYASRSLGVRESDLRYAVRKAKKRYGSMNRFLKKAYGLDKKKLKKLRKLYTE